MACPIFIFLVGMDLYFGHRCPGFVALVVTHVTYCVSRNFSRVVPILFEHDNFNGSVIVDLFIVFAFGFEF